jgi:hypothetical protein
LKNQCPTMASMKSRFRPAHLAKLHMLAGPFCAICVKNQTMKKITYYFLASIIFTSCGLSTDKKNETNQYDSQIIEQNFEELNISKGEESKIPISINEILDKIDTTVINGFKEFWPQLVPSIKEYKLNIMDSKILTIDNREFLKLKLAVIGIRDKSTATAYNNYLINFNNQDTFQIIYQTKFFQPECGTSDFTINSFNKLTFNENFYHIIEINERVEGCVNTPYQNKTHFVFLNNGDQIDELGELTIFHRIFDFQDDGTERTKMIMKSKIYKKDDLLALISSTQTDDSTSSKVDTSYYELSDKLKMK